MQSCRRAVDYSPRAAIVEVLLHAHSRAATKVIHSHSLWAIDAITGRRRPKHHKTLVNLARDLTRANGLDTRLHWIKGHAGMEGNRMADREAQKGKGAHERRGREQPSPRACRPRRPTRGPPPWRQPARGSQAGLSPQTHHTRAPDKACRAEANRDKDAKKLRNQAKRAARKDSVNWVQQRLMEDPEDNKKIKSVAFKGKRVI